jgi:integrase
VGSAPAVGALAVLAYYWAAPLRASRAAWDSVDLEQGTITVKRVVLDVDRAPLLCEIPKSESSQRTIAIPPLLVDLLRAQKALCLEAALRWGKGYRRQPMFVFARPDGEPHDPMHITHRPRVLMHRAKVVGHSPVHCWRHTCGTNLGGVVDTKTIRSRLGHSTPMLTLQWYVHPTEKRDQAAGKHLATLIKSPGGSA